MTDGRSGGGARVVRTASSPLSASVRRFAADSSLVLAGGRAILLQIADPVVAAGVARHSDFARRPQQRLVHTLMYVYAVVLGTPADASAAASFVNRAHVPVRGADDVNRQLWVAATLYESALRMHEILRGPVSEELAQEILDAYEPLGGALRVPSSRWPSTIVEFAVYWDAALASVRVTPEARQVVRDLLFPRLAPWWVRAVMPFMRLLTVGLLPPGLRAEYGFAWGPSEERRFARLARRLRAAVGVVPGPVRRLPVAWLLHRMRAFSTDPRAGLRPTSPAQ